jgi:hypothetical protein
MTPTWTNPALERWEAQYSAKEPKKHVSGPKRPYATRLERYSGEKPQRCECPKNKAWNIGDGLCGKCGKSL